MNNKTAFITGGTKGIGRAIAENFLQHGISVAITGRDDASTQRVAEQLSQQYGVPTIGKGCDVRDYNAQRALVQEIEQKWGRLDYVIANAGIGKFAPVHELEVDEWQQVIDTNLTGVFYTTKATVDALKKSEGYLITIASLAGTNFFEAGSVYNASKFGVVGFTQAAMLDLRKFGIKVTTIMPGSVSTHFNDNEPSEKDAWKIQPEDIAEMVMDLIKMNPRTLPSKIEVRPTRPDLK